MDIDYAVRILFCNGESHYFERMSFKLAHKEKDGLVDQINSGKRMILITNDWAHHRNDIDAVQVIRQKDLDDRRKSVPLT